MGVHDKNRPSMDDERYDQYEKYPSTIVEKGEFGICHYGGWFWMPGLLVGGGSFVALCDSALSGNSDEMPLQLLMTIIGGGAIAFGVYLDRRLGWYARWKAWKRDLDEIKKDEQSP